MMRILLAMSLIALTLACAHKDAGKGRSKTPGRKADNGSPLSYRQTDDVYFDSTFYIGYVDYFPETQEFYTALFYREGHEYPDDDLLQSKLDSVIVLDDDWGRERLPMDEARRILLLSGLDSISIYNRSHQLICKSRLARVEYLWNGLENYFIAVFESDGKPFEQTEELYGITSAYAPAAAPFSQVEIQNKILNEFLIKKLAISHSVDWEMRHYRITPPETTYSIISSYSMTSDEAYSYLTALESNTVSILNQEVNNFHFLNILPVPVMIKGKPLLLISAGYPSSDVIWDYLAAYDGGKYEAVEYNRVHLKTLEGNQNALVSR
jgi:hypothetical protein